jgi:hypothetical protein
MVKVDAGVSFPLHKLPRFLTQPSFWTLAITVYLMLGLYFEPYLLVLADFNVSKQILILANFGV